MQQPSNSEVLPALILRALCPSDDPRWSTPLDIVNGPLVSGMDVIGLSGLLVKSGRQMVLTAGDLAAVGITTPLLEAAPPSADASPT